MMYRLILVDDEPNTCEILADFIKEEQIGYEVAGSFRDGQQAWEYMQKKPVDCVITDIKMPCMDGLALARNIYISKNPAKVILLSGYGEFEYAQQGIKYGVTDYQLKPIDYEKLSEVLIQIRDQMDEQRRREKGFQVQPNRRLKNKDESGDYSIVAMETALRYLKEHYHEPISRDNVADACFMNSSYFGRCFKQYTERTFTEYLTDLRIQKSIQLLGKNITIEEIAGKVGYGSSRHFCRIFKEITGYTPKEYRMCILKQELEQ